jgi:hypothetical protein
VQQQSKAPLFQDEFILENPALQKSIQQQEPCTFLNGYIHLQYLEQSFLVQQPRQWLDKQHNYKCIWLFFLTLKLFPRFQSYYSHLQQMEYIAIAPCIKWRAYPGFALDEIFPKALLLQTWLIPKYPTAEDQIQSNVLLFHDEFILKSPALTMLINR